MAWLLDLQGLKSVYGCESMKQKLFLRYNYVLLIVVFSIRSNIDLLLPHAPPLIITDTRYQAQYIMVFPNLISSSQQSHDISIRIHFYRQGSWHSGG